MVEGIVVGIGLGYCEVLFGGRASVKTASVKTDACYRNPRPAGPRSRLGLVTVSEQGFSLFPVSAADFNRWA
jgi:hypothetical protein